MILELVLLTLFIFSVFGCLCPGSKSSGNGGDYYKQLYDYREKYYDTTGLYHPSDIEKYRKNLARNHPGGPNYSSWGIFD
jgi:hypothetical protein